MINHLKSIGACSEAIAWVESLGPDVTSQQAWDTCPRGDWLLWYAARAGVPRPTVVLAAAACAELALPHAGDLRPICEAAIAAARTWASNPSETIRAAAFDAAAAAYAAASDVDAAAAAHSAHSAAAYSAATSAARAAAAAAASIGTVAAARAASSAAAVVYSTADVVRSIIPEVPSRGSRK